MRKVGPWTKRILSSSVLVLWGCSGLKAGSNGGEFDGDLRRVLPVSPALEELRRGNLEQTPYLSLVQSLSCESARSAVVDFLSEQVKEEIERRARWSRRQEVASRGVDVMSAPEAAGASPKSVTKTNEHMAGVEEGDFVKNTSGHIFVAKGSRIEVVKSWPASEMTKVSALELGASPEALLLVGENRLVVVARAEPEALGSPSVSAASFEESMNLMTSVVQERHVVSESKVFVFQIDASDPKALKVVERRELSGRFREMRRHGDSVRILLESYLNLPESVRKLISFYGSPNPHNAMKLFSQAQAKLRGMNLAEIIGLVDSHDALLDWGLDSNCSNLLVPRVPTASTAVSRVVTLNLKTNALTQLMVAGVSADTTYVSNEAMVLASRLQPVVDFSEFQGRVSVAGDFTLVHKFDVLDETVTRYEGSGLVEGTLLNQFALDVHEGVLRVASTLSPLSRERSGSEWVLNSMPSRSRVTTLKLEGQALRIQGQTPDLAPGEQIYSVRFDAERAFVVTFRRVDPLFAIDLQDPSHPKVTGELKIPGFSNYMQLVDRNTILTVGRDADPETGRQRELKVSLFDVSDMKSPREISSHVLEDSSFSASEATYDFKAFTYAPHNGFLALPVNSWTPCGGPLLEGDAELGCGYPRHTSVLRLFRIDRTSGISDGGRVSMAGADRNVIRRSIFADDVVYAIGTGGITASALDHPESPLSQVLFESPE